MANEFSNKKVFVILKQNQINASIGMEEMVRLKTVAVGHCSCGSSHWSTILGMGREGRSKVEQKFRVLGG